ncbi:nuA3 HAT complex component nto1 [Apophysomyces ossiformis]|uniref:NuA3 HAT complex component nto1 n=1 Tax=Apophysomyces ossiformis TaxID=679940 RepID=A0A8H7EL81_9FUNG|nr:nuA3 HAT complex component nto1 [Apophysomyces ossiformis]
MDASFFPFALNDSMPLKARGRKGGRRGRPRKYPVSAEGRNPSVDVQLGISNIMRPTATTLHLGQHIDASKPREERSYKDFFPDLNIKEPLAIVHTVTNRDSPTVPSTQTLSPMPVPTDTSFITRETSHDECLIPVSLGTDEDNGVDPTSHDVNEAQQSTACIGSPGIKKNELRRNKIASPTLHEEISLYSDLEAGSDLSSVSDIDSEDEESSKGTPQSGRRSSRRSHTNPARSARMINTRSTAEPMKMDIPHDGSTITIDSEKLINDSSSTTTKPNEKAIPASEVVLDNAGLEDMSTNSMQQSKDDQSICREELEDGIGRDTATSGSLQIPDEDTPMLNVIQHVKEGDIYQALSTRPQHHPALSSPNLSNGIQPGISLGVNLAMLPKPSFRKITEEENEDDERMDESQKTIIFGTLVMSFFPTSTTLYTYALLGKDPTETELFDTVEYDMDEQDEVWLQMLNAERSKENLGEVSGDLFESIIDQLEKEWFDLIKNLPKQASDEPSLPEDSTCAICDDGECENSNAIVFCDGCNLAVHQDCYGIPYIPEGQWLCRKCMVSPENPVSCLFCPNEGGAFKQTNTNKWGHLLCAIWIPEVGLSNSVYMEPIDNIENIPKSRWKLTCYICRKRQGACIQCDNKHCFVAFHVTCARWARLCMRMKSHTSHYDGVVLKAYCDRHTPRDYREQVDVEQNVLAAQTFFEANKSKKNGHRTPRRRYVENDLRDEALLSQGYASEDEEKHKNRKRRKYLRDSEHSSRRHLNANAVTELLPSSKAARAHQHHYSAGAPIAPEHILVKLENLKSLRQAVDLRKKVQLVTSICRYWSLKRESRRGAPLLKRLHLEPWTASSQHKQTEVEKAHRASAMMSLRTDLEKVRMLSEQVQKREKQKLERIRKQKAYLEMVLFPIEYIAKPIVEQLMDVDKKDVFKYPVTAEVAPDYNDIIDSPMSFSDINDRLAAHGYMKLEDFEADLGLIWKNSMTYNKPDTSYYKLAQRLEKLSGELMVKAWKDFNSLAIRKETGTLAVDIHPEIFTYNTLLIPTPEELNAQKAAEEKRLAAESEARIRAEARAAAAEARKKKIQERKEEQAKLKAMPVGVTTRASRAKVDSESKPISREEVIAQVSVEKNTKTGSRVRTRSMGSDGLTAPTAERLRKKNSSEARRLLWPPDEYSLSGSKSEASYREDRSRRAPPGWVYLESEEEQEEGKEKLGEGQGERKKKREGSSTMKKKRKSTSTTVSFANDDIVWARVKGFPSHPAKIVDARREDVPERILKAKAHEQDLLVQFYEVPERHMWGWIHRSNVRLFGDPELDAEMLLQAKKTKRKQRIEEAKKGYRFACGIRGLDPEPQLDLIFSGKIKK